MSIPEDLYEEVARVNGYNMIENKHMYTDVHLLQKSPVVQCVRAMEETLAKECRCDQVETYPRADEKVLQLFGVDTTKLLSLKNAVAPELQYMRDDMIYNLLEYVKKNHKFFDTCAMYDIGKIRKQSDDAGTKDTNAIPSPKRDTPTKEHTQCGVILYKKNISDWKEDTLLIMKRIISIVTDCLGLGECSFVPTKHTQFHPKKQ